VQGLTLGGDDYVTKPFSLEEVVARIRSVLRRTSGGASRTGEAPRTARLAYADLVLDDDTHEVWEGDREVELSPTEFNLLRYFLQNPGRVLSKRQILEHVWDYDFGGDGNVVESYVSYLRKKVDLSQPRMLHTVRGVGYVLRQPKAPPA
jgi:two-component system OmpR family response regulator